MANISFMLQEILLTLQYNIFLICRSTHDIDLFPGAMTETPLPGGRLGPTFTCILALQFRALKYGDRFYYEGNTNLNPHPFTPWELEGFRPITMAKIICENTHIHSTPVNVFMKEDPDKYVNIYVVI